jgi:hypothetical protein
MIGSWKFERFYDINKRRRLWVMEMKSGYMLLIQKVEDTARGIAVYPQTISHLRFSTLGTETTP